jgi:hypothetical protein
MPFEIRNHGGYFHVRFHGIITAADLDRFADEAEAAEDSIPTALDRVTDLTSVEQFNVHFPDVEMLAARRRARRFSKPVKSAIIVRERVQLGLARMFQTLNDNPQIEIRIVHSVAEAENWFAGK